MRHLRALRQETTDAVARCVGVMVRTLVHRGPDAEGLFVAQGVALGHRRVSILDLCSTGAQPMTLGATTIGVQAPDFAVWRRAGISHGLTAQVIIS